MDNWRVKNVIWLDGRHEKWKFCGTSLRYKLQYCIVVRYAYAVDKRILNCFPDIWKGRLTLCTSTSTLTDYNTTTRSRLRNNRFIGVTESERAAFAALSAYSLPLIHIWLGIKHKRMFLPLLERRIQSSTNFLTRSTSIWKLLMASRLDFESEKIIKPCSLEQQTISIARTYL